MQDGLFVDIVHFQHIAEQAEIKRPRRHGAVIQHGASLGRIGPTRSRRAAEPVEQVQARALAQRCTPVTLKQRGQLEGQRGCFDLAGHQVFLTVLACDTQDK
jgi:hypothetical protein